MNEPEKLKTPSTAGLGHNGGPPLQEDLIHGVKNISREFGLAERQTYHLLRIKKLPGCFRLGRSWHCSRTLAREAIRAASMR
jgi:hypothetical protein